MLYWYILDSIGMMAGMMAECDSDSSVEDVIPCNLDNLTGYQFEPTVSSETEESHSQSSDSNGESDTGFEDRVGNVLWCTCQHCDHVLLTGEVEHTCCREMLVQLGPKIRSSNQGKASNETFQYNLMYCVGYVLYLFVSYSSSQVSNKVLTNWVIQ
jgi:hypothetical protein